MNPTEHNKAVPDWATDAAHEIGMAQRAYINAEPFAAKPVDIAAIIRKHAPSVPAVGGAEAIMQRSVALMAEFHAWTPDMGPCPIDINNQPWQSRVGTFCHHLATLESQLSTARARMRWENMTQEAKVGR